jgi:soluble lytic murein transglycosylase-like protein
MRNQSINVSYCTYWLNLLLLAAAPVWAQAPQDSQDSMAKQRSAEGAMQESLAKQRAAIARQMGAASNGNFFVLPRAGSLGANMAMPAMLSAPVMPSTMPIAPLCDPLSAPQVDSLVGETAARDGVDPTLLRTVMKQESGFVPCAVSSKGAMGLMQLMPATAQDLGIDDPFDPASNLDAGARFLKQLLDRYSGDLPKALGAYNAGPAKVDAAGGVPAIPETVNYVSQILAALPFR